VTKNTLWQRVERYFRQGSSSRAFWDTPLALGQNFAKQSGKGYYIDLSAKAGYTGPFDEQGIPLLNYYGNRGIQHNPAATAQYALGLLEKYWATGDENYRQRFFCQVDWLVDNLKIRRDGVGVWEYQFGLAEYNGLNPPWISALAQGQGISVLVRASLLTRNRIYLDKATAAFKPFLLPISAGGLQAMKVGHLFFEEAPSTPPSCILDGFLFSIFGVYDYYLATGDQQAALLYDQAIETVEACLPLYDMGFWSRADLFRDYPKMIASPFYHNLHVLQLRALAQLTKRQSFSSMADRWDRCQRNPINKLLAITYKILFKIFFY
jgi:heparosan-N-sulfate-glucuronate 5-epimerase